MKTIEIKGHLRESVGSKTAKQLRREGQVPCVVYGGAENTHFHADIRELNKLIYTPNVYQVNLDLGGKKLTVVVREPQYHPVGDELIHLDFVEVAAGKPVSIHIPVKLQGSAIGVRNGGSLRHNAKKLHVRGLIENIPDEIAIDITDMAIGQFKKVGDLSLPGIEVLEAENRVVVAVRTSRKAVEETPVEGAAATAPAEGAAAAPAAEK